MGQLWDLYQEWRDGMEFPPSHRQVAQRIELAPGTLAGWRDGLTELPQRSSLWRLHELTNIPFRKLMEAAVEDAGLFDEGLAEEAARARSARRGRSAGRQMRAEQDAQAEATQDPGGDAEPA